MAKTAPAPRRPRFMCMALNTAGRPVPMFDPFLGDTPGDEEAPEPIGEIERLLFGARTDAVADDRNGEGAASERHPFDQRSVTPITARSPVRR